MWVCSLLGPCFQAEVGMHIGSLVLVIWLIIGAIAAGQRGYYSGTIGNCTSAGTIAVTILPAPSTTWA
jgi:ABC-type dipeptide/oligopeptide/nickel transport system permease subunit